ncbi:MAG TPA: hypothetical protein VGN88_12535 [Phycisphaerae bacterium]|jgi:hypothetical protein
MGLTIHYDLHAPHLKTAIEARKLLASLRKFAKSLPFKDVTKILTWKKGKDDPILEEHFSHILWKEIPGQETQYYWAKPLELAFFSVHQPGAESAIFGLARYSKTATSAEGSKIPSNLPGWNWRRFCKTQYASMSAEGGWPNFFTIHDGICQILDQAAALGLRTKVLDESKYFEHRDPGRLEKEIFRWNTMIAAVVGAFKDRSARTKTPLHAPILATPEFEHLEAKGQHFLEQAPQIEVIRNPKPRHKRK